MGRDTLIEVRDTLWEVQDGSGHPPEVPERVGTSSGMGRDTFREVRDGSEHPLGGPGRVGTPSGRSGRAGTPSGRSETSRDTLQEVRESLHTLC